MLALNACTFQIRESAVLIPTPEAPDAVPVLSQLKGLDVQPRELHMPMPDGVVLHGLWIPWRTPAPTVLYFGGNVSRVSENAPVLAKSLRTLGVNLLLVDYRGSGRSPGAPVLAQLEADALIVHDYAVRELGVAPEQLLLHGFSLGSFMAGHVSLHRPIAGLVLEASATTTEQWARSLVPWYAKPIVRIEITPSMRGKGNLSVVQQQSAPLLLLVGSQDRSTKPKLSRRLAAAARDAGRTVTLVEIAGAGHGGLLQRPETLAAYRGFLKQAVSAGHE